MLKIIEFILAIFQQWYSSKGDRWKERYLKWEEEYERNRAARISDATDGVQDDKPKSPDAT